MNTKNAREAMKKSICANVDFEELGIGECLVHTGFTYHDGDELHIVLKEESGRWKLTDEGHTMMWLSYDDFNMTDVRKKLFENAIAQNNVEYDTGRIYVNFSAEEEAGTSLYSLVQAILQITDLRYLDRKTVASTFIEDMFEMVKKTNYHELCSFKEKISLKNEEYCEPDILINAKNPILVFGINNSNRAKKSLIDIMALKQNNMNQYRLVLVIDDTAIIDQKTETMLINRTDKSIFGINGLVDGINRFVEITS